MDETPAARQENQGLRLLHVGPPRSATVSKRTIQQRGKGERGCVGPGKEGEDHAKRKGANESRRKGGP